MATQLPLIFVNQTNIVTTTPNRVVIRSHVHGSYRKWNKVRRAKRLLGSQKTEGEHSISSTHGAFIKAEKNSFTSGEPLEPRALSKKDLQTIKLLRTPYSIGHGNSDPFNAAAITTSPVAHELLQLSYSWQLYLEYPGWASLASLPILQDLYQQYRTSF